MYASIGAARARWLAELNSALEEALRLLKIAEKAHDADSILELVLRIEAVRLEIRALQLGGARIAVKFDPLWSRRSGSGENLTDLA